MTRIAAAVKHLSPTSMQSFPSVFHLTFFLSTGYIYAWVLTIGRSTCGYVIDLKAFLFFWNSQNSSSCSASLHEGRIQMFLVQEQMTENMTESSSVKALKVTLGPNSTLTWNSEVWHTTLSWCIELIALNHLHDLNGMWHENPTPPPFFFLLDIYNTKEMLLMTYLFLICR